LTVSVLRFVGPVRKPEAGFDVAAEPRCLRTFSADESVKVFIRDQTPNVEEASVGPVRREEYISRSRSGLQASRQQASVCARQVCASGRKLRAELEGGLGRSSAGSPPEEAILDQQHRIAKTRSA